MLALPFAVKIKATQRVTFALAERVGFEPTVRCRITSFQDWLLKPLGHLSIDTNYTILLAKSQADNPWIAVGIKNRCVCDAPAFLMA